MMAQLGYSPVQHPGWGLVEQMLRHLVTSVNTLPPFHLNSSTEDNNSHQLAASLQTRAMCEQMMSYKAAAAAVVFT